VLISTAGSGQMLPLPMNEYVQDNLKQACGVNVEFDTVEWNVLLDSIRLPPDSPRLRGSMALNISLSSSDVSLMARIFSSANFAPNGFNFSQWKDDKFDAALARLATSTDPAEIQASYSAAHERIVDNPPWLFIVHDLNPRAMSKKVHGFVPAQSWFVDLTRVSVRRDLN
jgi:peptide/nickel transport system substrate-binding protein